MEITTENKNEFQGKLRNMTCIYLSYNNQMLLLYRQGSRVVNNLWVGSAGGHFRHYLEVGRYTDMLYGGIADGKKVVFIEMPEF